MPLTQLSGDLTAIRGSVIDIRSSESVLPALNEGIAIARDEGAPLVAEVQQHLDFMTVRAVLLDNTAGLSRGMSFPSRECSKACNTGPSVGSQQAYVVHLLIQIGRASCRERV